MKARENKASINQRQNRIAFKCQGFREAGLLSHAFTRQAFFLGQRHKTDNSRAKPAENANKLSETTAKIF